MYDIGAEISAGLPEISGDIGLRRFYGPNNNNYYNTEQYGSGAFSYEEEVYGSNFVLQGINVGINSDNILFSASASDSIYSANTVQPNSIIIQHIIKI